MGRRSAEDRRARPPRDRVWTALMIICAVVFIGLLSLLFGDLLIAPI